MKFETEWALIAEGMDPAALTELRSYLSAQGYILHAGTHPTAPICTLQLDGQATQITTRMQDRGPNDSPIEIGAMVAGGDQSQNFPVLASKVRWALEQTAGYKNLVDSIRSRKAIAFIGSGLSVELEYPTWNALVRILLDKAELEYEEDNLKNGSSLLAAMETCKTVLKQQYYDVLTYQFREKKPGFTTVHTDLLQMPFASYMTTNIDPCLEVAFEHLANPSKQRSVQVWPEITRSAVGSGDIFYLHAKVPRSNQGDIAVSRIRMTTSEYEEAYDRTEHISALFKQAIEENYILIFIGYGLREPAIKNLLDAAVRHRERLAEQYRAYGIPIGSPPMHFALMPEGETPEEEIVALLERCRVQIIDFSTKEKNFAGLRYVLDDLYRRTTTIISPEIRHLGVVSVDERGTL